MTQRQETAAGEQAVILHDVVVRFSGDSGDGMQLVGNILAEISAEAGNDISTYPDYPADIRAPQGSLTGVSGFQVHIGSGRVFTPGDRCDVLIAMNAAALKTQHKFCKSDGCIIVDSDGFGPQDLRKALYQTDDPFSELGIAQEVLAAPISTMVKECLAGVEGTPSDKLKCRNMFALGLVCWLLDSDLDHARSAIAKKFARKPAVATNNLSVLQAGYDYGHNTHAAIAHPYRIAAPQTQHEPGLYIDINGNKATAYGLMAAAERAGLRLYLGSYPITPATDVLHELAKHKSLGVVTVQCEDEIAGCASAIGAAFGGALAVTSTSGPGLCLKSEAMNLAVMTELPLVVLDVQRGGPSTGLPTKCEQSDLLDALFGRSGESPLAVLAATSPTDCFTMAYEAARIALEHMTPVILLTDAFIANGSAAFRLPDIEALPPIDPPFVKPEMAADWTPYRRNPQTLARYWAVPGTPGFEHIVGGLEKSNLTGELSSDPDNHQTMTQLRAEKIARIPVPPLSVQGDAADADLLVVGFGGTYGHLLSAVEALRGHGRKVALAQLKYINPLPANTADVLRRYPRVVVAELNGGQLAAYLRMKTEGVHLEQFDRVMGKPFDVHTLVEAFEHLIDDKKN